MSKKKLSTQPPIIFTHNESGAIVIGEDKDDTIRVRDIGLYACLLYTSPSPRDVEESGLAG